MARKHSSETELAVSSTASALPRRKSASAARARKKSAVVPVEAVAEPIAAAVPEVNAVKSAPVSEPAYETVAALAYSYWVARGYQGGSPEEDWLRAEQELRLRNAATA